MQSAQQKSTAPVVFWIIALAFVAAFYLAFVFSQPTANDLVVPHVHEQPERPFARRQPVQFEQYKTPETSKHNRRGE